VNIHDAVGLRKETEAVKALGYSCKLAIHPVQIAPINSVFTPDTKELAVHDKPPVGDPRPGRCKHSTAVRSVLTKVNADPGSLEIAPKTRPVVSGLSASPASVWN
jgi:hypothetical protein